MAYNPTGLTGSQYNTLFERIPVSIDSALGILNYGLDNLYPQRMEQLRLNSPLVKSSTEVLEDFLNGTGWESSGDTIVNRNGETYDDVLNQVARDASRFSGAFALHLNFDGTGQALELQRIPFEYVRLARPNLNTGRVEAVLVSDNWERSSNKKDLKPIRYRMLNPLTAQEDVIKTGRGQVLYFTGMENGMYPLASFDSIINTAITDASIQLYEKNNVTRGFHGATVMNYRGAIESEREKREVKAKAEELIGTNGPGILVMVKDSDDTSPTLETIAGNDTSDLFTVTLGAVQDRVLQVFKQPPALMGISPEGGVFTQLAYQESYIVYNVITRNGRRAISTSFNKVSELMGESLGKIIENRFAIEGETEVIQTQETV